MTIAEDRLRTSVSSDKKAQSSDGGVYTVVLRYPYELTGPGHVKASSGGSADVRWEIADRAAREAVAFDSHVDLLKRMGNWKPIAADHRHVQLTSEPD